MSEPHDDEALDLGGTYHDREPDPGVEDGLVRRLRDEQLLLRPRGSGRIWLARAAAAVLFFLAGWAASSYRGELPSSVAVTEPDGQRYMMLLWEDDRYEPETAVGERAEEYAAWARAVVGRGVPLTGAELGPEREIFPPSRTGPTGSGDDLGRVAGYFIVEVGDLRDAEALAAGHPHVSHGGVVEVAPIR